MKNLRILAVLLFALPFIAAAVLDRTVNSQGQDLNAQTNQADKVSGTARPIPFPPVNNCPNDIDDCEGSNPNDDTTFTFSAADGERPVAADACPTPNCEPFELCVMPACEEDRPRAIEAPAAFDRHTNDPNFLPQGSPIPKFPADPGPTPGTFAADEFIFGIVDEKEDGLGPVYNAQSCRECHQNPVPGGISQITELRAGHNETNGDFTDAPGGSLINDRAINPKVQERVPPLFSALVYPQTSPTPSPAPSASPITAEESVRTFRTSLNLLGDGFVEAIPNGTLLAIANAQAAISNGQVHGLAIAVPVLEANFTSNRDCADPMQTCHRRIGRFGWKDQIASLLSFSGDAYLNEIGITNFLILKENTSLGRPVSAFDEVSDKSPCDDPLPAPTPGGRNPPCGEDTERDIDTFTAFMRATKAPPQDHDIQQVFSSDVQAGRALFTQMPGLNYSCSICHVPAIVTAQPGTLINSEQFEVPFGLGFKIIRPFGDFLLHDIGTGDGIVQNGTQVTRLRVRTAPLWGVRTRTRLMHDGSSVSPTGSSTPPNGASFTFKEAILRHQGEAAAVTAAFQALSETQKRQLIKFIESL
jgi:CxxC motif-containing protein (DUF1111 family)